MLLITHALSVVCKFSTHVMCLNKHLICYGGSYGPPKEVLTIESLRELFDEEVMYYQHKHF